MQIQEQIYDLGVNLITVFPEAFWKRITKKTFFKTEEFL
jgi:hypothetical protein